jgi:hypothetical protein
MLVMHSPSTLVRQRLNVILTRWHKLISAAWARASLHAGARPEVAHQASRSH